MQMFFADCTACNWEGEASENRDAAANSAVQHAASAHPAMLSQHTLSPLRIWTYEGLQVTVSEAEAPAERKEKHEPHTAPKRK